LVSGLKSISVNAQKISQNTKSPTATEIPEVTFEGYRGKGDLVRQIINNASAEKKPISFSKDALWWKIMDEVRLDSSDRPNLAQRIVESFDQQSIGSGYLWWGRIEDASASQDRANLAGFTSGQFEVYPKFGNGLRIVTRGELSLVAPEPDPERSQEKKSKSRKVLDFFWNETLRDRDAIITTTRRTDEREGQVLISVCERVDLLPGFESMSPQARDLRQWREQGPERMEKFLKRAEQWSSNAEPRLLATEEWTRRLSDGRTVTLIAVGRHPAAPFCWWTPEGKPLRSEFLGDLKEYGTRTPGAAFLKVFPGQKVQSQAREVDLREQPAGMVREIGWNGPVYHMIDSSREVKLKNADRMESTFVVPITRSEDLQAGIFDVWFGMGEWTSIGSVGKEKNSKANLQERTVEILNHQDYSESGHKWTVVSVESQVKPHEELKLVAVNRDGKRFEGHYKRGAFVTRLDGTIQISQVIENINDIGLPDIDHFEVLVRPLEKLRFENVNFAPDGLTLDPENPTEQLP